MDRRLTGALLLIAAVSLAAVIPILGGVRLAGVGTIAQLPDEPKAGDCVLPSPNDPPADSTAPLRPTFAACDGRRVAGEVVAVVGAKGELSARLDATAASGTDCRRSALEQSGLILRDGRPLWAELDPLDLVSWDLSISLRASLLVPSPLLRSAGQEWVACVAAPVSGEPYQGRLAGAFTGGRLPSEFGVCGAEKGPRVLSFPAPCRSPHFAELVATATIPGGGRITVADVEDSCGRIAALVVGRPDPTAAGQLSVETSMTPAAGQFLALPQPQNVTCYISSVTRPLSATLVGLGDRPIPFSR